MIRLFWILYLFFSYNLQVTHMMSIMFFSMFIMFLLKYNNMFLYYFSKSMIQQLFLFI